MASTSQVRSVTIERSNGVQSIRIPSEFALSGEEATVTQDPQGRLLIEDSRPRGLSPAHLAELLDSWEPLSEEDSMPDIPDLVVEPFDL